MRLRRSAGGLQDCQLQQLGTATPLKRQSFRDGKGKTRLRLHQPRGLLVLPTGEVFILGRDRQQGVLAVDRWPTNGAASVIEPRPNHIYWDRWDPSLGPRLGTLVADEAGQVYVTALAPVEAPDYGYLAKFDGQAWDTVDVAQLPGAIHGIAAGQGFVTVAAKGQVWRRRDGTARWQRLAIPADTYPDTMAHVAGGLLFDGPGAVFLVPAPWRTAHQAVAWSLADLVWEVQRRARAASSSSVGLVDTVAAGR